MPIENVIVMYHNNMIRLDVQLKLLRVYRSRIIPCNSVETYLKHVRRK